MKNTNKKDNIYETNPEVIAFFAIKDGKVIFDVNDSKITIPEIMVITSNLVSEYTKSIAQLQQSQQEE